MKDNDIIHHTYQPKGGRAYKIVIKHLHHSLNPKGIKEELKARGHKVKNVTNALYRKTKEPLNMFSFSNH